MNAVQFNRLLRNNDLLAQVDTEELYQLTKDYPWFGIGQVLNAAQLQQQLDERAHEQIQKALLFVQNPQWLQVVFDRLNAKQKSQENFQVAEASTDSLVVLNQTEIKTDHISIDNETEAAINADVIVEAADTLTTDIDSETEAAINAESLSEATVENRETQITPLSSILTQPLKEGEDQLSFEPLYAVDYFASQGIKLKEEMLQKDQLGKQLKTFTQWLKTMKKVYVEENKELDESAEKEVVQKAVESNTGEEIITEAMASVLEQQGKTAKAVELYRKLCLLHPEKSPYFAAQIERLNK
jgi:hypothetical protein